jgi:hypothetical protein
LFFFALNNEYETPSIMPTIIMIAYQRTVIGKSFGVATGFISNGPKESPGNEILLIKTFSPFLLYPHTLQGV